MPMMTLNPPDFSEAEKLADIVAPLIESQWNEAAKTGDCSCTFEIFFHMDAIANMLPKPLALWSSPWEAIEALHYKVCRSQALMLVLRDRLPTGFIIEPARFTANDLVPYFNYKITYAPIATKLNH